MQKITLLILSFFLVGVLHANEQRVETPQYISYKIDSLSYEEVILLITNELQVNSFSIVYKIDIAKAMGEVAIATQERATLKYGISLGFCKPSLSYSLLKKAPVMLLYCPFSMVIYQTEESNDVTISFLKATQLSEEVDSRKLDAMIENIIIKSLE